MVDTESTLEHLSYALSRLVKAQQHLLNGLTFRTETFILSVVCNSFYSLSYSEANAFAQTTLNHHRLTLQSLVQLM
jgi:hypothetical protein